MDVIWRIQRLSVNVKEILSEFKIMNHLKIDTIHESRHAICEPNYLNNASVFPGSNTALLNSLGPSADHFAGGEDQSSGLGLSESHDHSCKPTRVVLRISCLEGDVFEIQRAVEIDRGNDVSRR